jgi:hypothetical protein
MTARTPPRSAVALSIAGEPVRGYPAAALRAR